MDSIQVGVFLIAAIALLGSPGPAIAALLVIGRNDGWQRGLMFYLGLQVGLAVAAGISITGLFALMNTLPGGLLTMRIGSSIYLLFLAYKIGTAPVGGRAPNSIVSSPIAGLLLGLSNPKAYAAFLSLFATFVLINGQPGLDGLLKWFLCVLVMIVVDLLWLGVGVRIGKARLSRTSERVLNLILAASVLVATVSAFL